MDNQKVKFDLLPSFAVINPELLMEMVPCEPPTWAEKAIEAVRTAIPVVIGLGLVAVVATPVASAMIVAAYAGVRLAEWCVYG